MQQDVQTPSLPLPPQPRFLEQYSNRALLSAKLCPSHLLDPRRAKGSNGPRRWQQRLREVASPDIANPPVHRDRQQHSPKSRREVEGRLLMMAAVVVVVRESRRT